MSKTALITSFTGSPLVDASLHTPNRNVCHRRSNLAGLRMADESKTKGLFGKLKDSILKPLVTVPGGGDGGSLIECVFCKGTGVNDCDACKGSGKDALGTCFMCNGKTYLTCTVCCGVGTVDRIRRGGTDDRKEYVVQKKKKKKKS